jgi:hypothetical protein
VQSVRIAHFFVHHSGTDGYLITFALNLNIERNLNRKIMNVIQNTVELRVVAITLAKEYVKDVKSLLEESKKIEKYIQGSATIPDVVEDPSNPWMKCLEEMRKSTLPSSLPEPQK